MNTDRSITVTPASDEHTDARFRAYDLAWYRTEHLVALRFGDPSRAMCVTMHNGYFFPYRAGCRSLSLPQD